MFSSLKKSDDLDEDLLVIGRKNKNQINQNEQDGSSENSIVDPNLRSVIIDVGSSMTRCGFGGDDAPCAVFPTIVGRWKEKGPRNDSFVGDEAQAKRAVMRLTHPVEHGYITNWNDFEKILHHSFYNELRVDPEEHPVSISETPLNKKNDKEKLISILFETFNVPAYNVGNRAMFACLASGRTTGLIAGIGDTVSTCVPIFEGQSIDDSTIRINLGGRQITNHLVSLLSKREIEMTSSTELEIVRDIKEKLCYLALDYDAEKTTDGAVKYELPDGSEMEIKKSERFEPPEIIFNPSKYLQSLDNNNNNKGFHESIYTSIQKCNIDIRKDMYQNIVLWGGSTMFEGLIERLSYEVQRLGPRHSRIKINAPSERKFSSWIGMSIHASTTPNWITKENYDEIGPSIVHRD